MPDPTITVFGQESFNKAVAETFAAIDMCIDRGLFVPAQMLIFSALDAFSYIELPQVGNSMIRFQAWVDKRVLPHDGVLCDAVDLYAARSAILHRLGVQSRLSESGQAASIAFSHGDAPFATLRGLRDSVRTKTGKIVPIVRLEALADALAKGVAAFLQDVEADPDLKARMERYWKAEQPFRFLV
jgi:hypothetical protein